MAVPKRSPQEGSLSHLCSPTASSIETKFGRIVPENAPVALARRSTSVSLAPSCMARLASFRDVHSQKETGSAVGLGARSRICTATDFSLIMRIGFH